jgi:hypothetical protein
MLIGLIWVKVWEKVESGFRKVQLLDLKVKNNLFNRTDLLIYQQKMIKLKGQVIKIEKQ